MHATSITFTSPETPTCEVPSNGVVVSYCLSVLKLRFRLGRVTQKPLAHCTALENGADLRVNERQMIRHYRARSTEERIRRRRRRRTKNAKSRFFNSRGEYVNLRYMAMLYTHSIGNQP